MNEQVNLLHFFDDVSGPFQEIYDNLGVIPGTGWPDRLGTALREWSRKGDMPTIRTLSLFSGGGGLDIGFHDAGFSVRTMVEIDKRYVETLKANRGTRRYFGDVDVRCVDIREYHPDDDAEYDFIIGGPPCQTFSAAGRRAAGVPGTCDERGVLFREYVRLLESLSPKGFLFENVYGLTGAEGGEALDMIREAFSEVGYKIFYRILDTADYGVPQHRERLIIVGIKEGIYHFPRPIVGPDSLDNVPYVTAAEAIHGVHLTDKEKEASVNGKYGFLLDDIPPGLNYSYYTEKMGHPNPVFAWRSKFSDFLYKADPNTPTRTIKALAGQFTGPFHWDNRPFSVAELKRLQTFPDDYTLVGNKGVSAQQIGNSVPPQLARILALSILQQVFSVQLPFRMHLLGPEEVLGFRKRKRRLTSIYKEKARVAISTLTNSDRAIEVGSRAYTASLSDDFGWTEFSDSQGEIQVEFRATKEKWRIEADGCANGGGQGFSIHVTPSGRVGWGFGPRSVELIGNAVSRKVFTGAWKAFESELFRSGLKADVVQLCGYYQYTPAMKCSMSLENGNGLTKEWEIVRKVVNGNGVGEIHPLATVAQLWGVAKKDVLSHAQFLKTLGYEVRNHNTNPQIEKGHYLVPYSFPTFNPMSVQLRKSLEGEGN